MSNYELNVKLIEAYGALEQLCNQIYNEQHGVSSYIEDMCKNGLDNTSSYKTLKEMRYKRNQLSHGEISFDCQFAYIEDVEFLISFKDKILNQTDTLAQYRLKKECIITKKSNTTVIKPNISINTKPKKSFWQKIKDFFNKY